MALNLGCIPLLGGGQLTSNFGCHKLDWSALGIQRTDADKQGNGLPERLVPWLRSPCPHLLDAVLGIMVHVRINWIMIGSI